MNPTERYLMTTAQFTGLNDRQIAYRQAEHDTFHAYRRYFDNDTPELQADWLSKTRATAKLWQQLTPDEQKPFADALRDA